MQTLFDQGYLPALEAVKKCTGVEPHIQTVRRWIKSGLQGCKLEAKLVAGAYFTTPEAVQEFVEATTKARLDKHDEVQQ